MRFLIDTDTASDDAVALIMAANNPAVQIEAITIVAGNVPMAQGVQNAAYTLQLCRQQVPIYAGMEKPLLRALRTADHVHGKDGMSDIGLPLHGFVPASGHAVNELIRRINAHPHELTLVCLGPLTNLAMAILLDKSIVHKLKKCVVMGGVGQGRGNVTPIAEYNFWADPEAARIVFESGLSVKLVGWDVSRTYAVFDSEDVARLNAIGTPLAEFAVAIQKTLVEYAQNASHLRGFDLPDPIAMAVAIDDAVVTVTQPAHVTILTNDDYSRGQSVMDYIGATGQAPNAEVVLEADETRFKQMLHAAVAVTP